ncbi:hypothetical protein CSC70_01740 [Pseudoxanthomonas kalamensis DSM 18571]|nr:hypothetical protein CSC70_01740 [Pseudoxanthomonas kalamensis DSM 18571]
MLLVFAAQAQVNVPKPKEFYFDEDRTAEPIRVVEAEGDALVEKLQKERERGRRRVEATAQLAHYAFGEGRTDLATSLYQAALDASQAKSIQGRTIRWNYGWDMFRHGETQAALDAWAQLATDAIGGPSWMPPTLALALWTTDRKDEAVQWYAAAVRTEPSQWSSTANFSALLPDWSEQERATLGEVQAAWLQNPPAWP